MQTVKHIIFAALGMLVIFAILDLVNLTGVFIFPVSSLTGKNKALTSALGNTAAILGSGSNGGTAS